MRGCLVGDDVGLYAQPDELRQHFRRVAEEPDRDRFAFPGRALDDRQRFLEVLRRDVEITGAQAELEARGPAFDREQRSARHRRRQRLRAAHAAQSRSQDPFAFQRAAVMAPAHLDKGLVGALDDALRADIDPRPRRHLAVHHQALAIELVEVVPGRPMRHQVRVGDQHARRVCVGLEHADRLSRLDEQRLVGLQPPQGLDDLVEGVPVARRAADAAVNHQLARALGDIGIEVVHQHAHRRFGEPALGGDLRPARRAHHAHVVEAGFSGHGGYLLISTDKGEQRLRELSFNVARVGAAKLSSNGVGQLSGRVARARPYRRGRRAPSAPPRRRPPGGHKCG